MVCLPTLRQAEVLFQHFSGHTVKQLYTAIRNPGATNNHWQNVGLRL